MHDPHVDQHHTRRRRHPTARPWLIVGAFGLAWLLVGQHLAAQAGMQVSMTDLPPAAHAASTTPRASPRAAPPSVPSSAAPSVAPPPSWSWSPATAARAVAFARAQLGKPYLWGAEGPAAYDCSGLTYQAWKHAGLAWARLTAADQWRYLQDPTHGHSVPASQLQPGDLLFYATSPNDPASIHHVAMAIGQVRMVEAYAPGVPIRTITIRHDGYYAAARPSPPGD